MYKLIIFLTLLGLNLALAQEKGNTLAKQDNALKYTLKSYFPVNVQLVYELTDTTKFTRIFSDSSKKSYTRIIKYYFSLSAPSAPDKEKIQEINVSVDSLEYSFNTADVKIYYNSQDDELRPPKIDDYLGYMVPLGLEFNFVYSPYFEVGNINGEIYEKRIKMLNDPLTKPSDTLNLFVWSDRIEKTNLSTYFDVVKSFYPSQRIAIDSLWTKNLQYDIEGATIQDSAQFKLKSFNLKSFIIEGQSLSAKSLKGDKAIIPSIRYIIDVDNAKGYSNYYIKLQPKGILEELKINSQFNIEYKVNNDIILQEVNTNRNWKLLGMYKI